MGPDHKARIGGVLFAALALVSVGCAPGPGPTTAGSQPAVPSANGNVVSPTPAVVVTPSPPPAVSPTVTPTVGPPASGAAGTATSAGTITVHGKSQTFSSVRYAYSLTVPANWLVAEIAGKWNGIAKGVGEQDAGTDRFSDPGVIAIEVGFQAQAPGTGVAAWEAGEASWVLEGDCAEAASTEQISVAGQAMLLLAETCPAQVIGENPGNQSFLNAFLVHGSNGILIQMNSRKGHEATDRATFLQILGTLKLGASAP